MGIFHPPLCKAGKRSIKSFSLTTLLSQHLDFIQQPVGRLRWAESPVRQIGSPEHSLDILGRETALQELG